MVRLLVCLCFFLLAHADDAPFSNISMLYQGVQKALVDKDLRGAERLGEELLREGPSSLPNSLIYYDISTQIALLQIEKGKLKAARQRIGELEALELPKTAEIAILFTKARLAAAEKGAAAGLHELKKIEEQLPFVEWPQSEKLFHHTICHTQNSRCDALLAKADEAFKNRRFSLALQRYEELFELLSQDLYPKASKNPSVVTHIRFYMAKTLAYLGEHAKAVDQYASIADEHQPASEVMQIHFELGVSLLKLGQRLSAKEHFERVASSAKTSDPFYHRSRLLLAQAAFELKDLLGADRALKEIEEQKGLCSSVKVLHKAALLALKVAKEDPMLSHAAKHLSFAESELLKRPEDDRVAVHLAEIWHEMSLRHKRPSQHKIESLLKSHVFQDDEVAAHTRFLLIQSVELDEAFAHLKVLTMPHLIKTKSGIEALIWISERLLEEDRTLEAEQYIALAEKEATEASHKKRAAEIRQRCLKALYEQSR